MPPETAPLPLPTSRPGVLAGWRIAVFVYVLVGGTWFSVPSTLSLAIHTQYSETTLLKAAAWVLFTLAASLVLSSVIIAGGILIHYARSLAWARLFCVGKIIYASLALASAYFLFHGHWSFTSPPESLSSISFATLALLYLLFSRKVRAILAAERTNADKANTKRRFFAVCRGLGVTMGVLCILGAAAGLKSEEPLFQDERWLMFAMLFTGCVLLVPHRRVLTSRFALIWLFLSWLVPVVSLYPSLLHLRAVITDMAFNSNVLVVWAFSLSLCANGLNASHVYAEARKARKALAPASPAVV